LTFVVPAGAAWTDAVEPANTIVGEGVDAEALVSSEPLTNASAAPNPSAARPIVHWEATIVPL
jgi:hypothetical protein